MSKLRVRVYNVRFGDAILISVPDKGTGDKETVRHILIDMGNLTKGEEGSNEVFGPVLDDVIEQVGKGKKLDLYVMTHEHMDHVQGPLFCAVKLGKTIQARHVWLTASAAKDYYEHHPEAKKKKLEAEAEYRRIAKALSAAPGTGSGQLDDLLANNNRVLGVSAAGTSHGCTADCVDFVRTLAPESKTHYVHRESKLKGKHPFKEAKLTIWAPEEDTSDYYGKLKPLALASVPAGTVVDGAVAPPAPPPGVDPAAFQSLLSAMGSGMTENLRAIDKAANDTSIVFCLEWRGWRLLFPGDAEEKSWLTMWKNLKDTDELQPVHFLKVSHHGSETGIPKPDGLVQKLFPKTAPDEPIPAVVSMYPAKDWPSIPAHEEMSKVFKGRCSIHYMHEECPAERPWLDYEFEG